MKPEVTTVPEENSHALSLGRLWLEAKSEAPRQGTFILEVSKLKIYGSSDWERIAKKN